MVLPSASNDRVVDAMITSPPFVPSAPVAWIEPNCPIRSPVIVTDPGAAFGDPADTSSVPVLTTTPLTSPAGRIAPAAVAATSLSSPPISLTTPSCCSRLRARITPLWLTTDEKMSPEALACRITWPPSAWMVPLLVTAELSGLPSGPVTWLSTLSLMA